MNYIGSIFLALNAVVSVLGVFHWSRLWNRSGVWGMSTPAGWIWVWQGLGVGLVLYLEASPWHLLWWFPAGFVICLAVGRILYRAGIIHL